MKTLDDLTPEIKAKIPYYKELCTKNLYSGQELKDFDPQKAAEYVELVYGIANQKRPVVLFADTPREFTILYNVIQRESLVEAINSSFEKKNSTDITNTEILESINPLMDAERILFEAENKGKSISSTSHWLVEISSYSRAYFTWFYFIHKELELPTSKSEILEKLYNTSRNGIMRGFFSDSFVLLLKAPEHIKRNEIGFHSVHDAAILYKDSPMYYINGRRMEADLFERVKAGTFTLKEYLAFENEEDRASVATLIKEGQGEKAFLDFLGAECIDEQTVQHTKDYSEVLRLYKTKKTYIEAQDQHGNRNQSYAWLNMVCPSTNQEYLIPTCPTFTDAVECAKWLRPENVPVEIQYSWISAN